MCAQHFRVYTTHPHPSSHFIFTRAQWTRQGRRFSLSCLTRTPNITSEAAFKQKWTRVRNRGERWFPYHRLCLSVLPTWNLMRSEMSLVMQAQWEGEFRNRAARNRLSPGHLQKNCFDVVTDDEKIQSWKSKAKPDDVGKHWKKPLRILPLFSIPVFSSGLCFCLLACICVCICML